jgi:hypothetical protein
MTDDTDLLAWLRSSWVTRVSLHQMEPVLVMPDHTLDAVQTLAVLESFRRTEERLLASAFAMPLQALESSRDAPGYARRYLALDAAVEEPCAYPRPKRQRRGLWAQAVDETERERKAKLFAYMYGGVVNEDCTS